MVSSAMLKCTAGCCVNLVQATWVKVVTDAHAKQLTHGGLASMHCRQPRTAKDASQQICSRAGLHIAQTCFRLQLAAGMLPQLCTCRHAKQGLWPRQQTESRGLWHCWRCCRCLLHCCCTCASACFLHLCLWQVTFALVRGTDAARATAQAQVVAEGYGRGHRHCIDLDQDKRPDAHANAH